MMARIALRRRGWLGWAGLDAAPEVAVIAPVPRSGAPQRLVSIDGCRGLVMLLMMAEVLEFRRMAQAFPERRCWQVLAFHQTHVEWIGCSLHDMIQPSFSFLVGVALPFSLASRAARGHSGTWLWFHALWRALLLVLLGVFLRSTQGPQTYWTFEDTLSQIGLGYPLLFLLGFRPRREQWMVLGAVLVGYWAAFALYPVHPVLPLPPEVSAVWLQQHGLAGFAAHWQKNANAAWAFDTWFLNLFPRAHPFLGNAGGYSTLNFIPTLGTMILGLLAGGVLRNERSAGWKTGWLALAGGTLLAGGWALGALGLCPVVKRIWSPAWVLWSGGLCCFFLATFYAVADVGRQKGWMFPLKVIGMNSIAAYCIVHLFGNFILQNWRIHLGPEAFRIFGETWEPLVQGGLVLLTMWLLLLWMYRRQLFLRI